MRAAQRPAGGGAVSGSSARSSPSETGFDWLTDDDCRAFGEARGLSKRLIHVLILTCHGDKHYAMARRLGIKPSTVGTYMDRLHKKLGLTDRLAIRTAVEQFAWSRRAGES